MLRTYSDISAEPYFSRELFERVEKVLVDEGINPHSIRYQFTARPDLEGIPYMLYATARVEDEDNG